jgi:hypothetical protein
MANKMTNDKVVEDGVVARSELRATKQSPGISEPVRLMDWSY